MVQGTPLVAAEKLSPAASGQLQNAETHPLQLAHVSPTSPLVSHLPELALCTQGIHFSAPNAWDNPSDFGLKTSSFCRIISVHTPKIIYKKNNCIYWVKLSILLACVAVLAEVPLRSPHKLFIFIIQENNCWLKVSKNKII